MNSVCCLWAPAKWPPFI